MDRHYPLVDPLLVPCRARVRTGPPDRAFIAKDTAPTTAATTSAGTRRQSRRGPPPPQSSQSSSQSQSQQETNGYTIIGIFGVEFEFAFVKLVLLLAPTRLRRMVRTYRAPRVTPLVHLDPLHHGRIVAGHAPVLLDRPRHDVVVVVPCRTITTAPRRSWRRSRPISHFDRHGLALVGRRRGRDRSRRRRL